MIPAALIPGLPPLGKGIYARDTIEAGAWDFVAINAWRADRASQASEARSRGAAVWLYGTPERFRPDNWRESVAFLRSEAARLGAVGVIVDAEGGWTGASAEREAGALGAACRALASDVRVCFTSYPEWTHLGAFAEAAGASVSGNCQIYGRTALSADTFARWLGRWRAYFGVRTTLAIAGWPSSDGLSTPEGFRRYLTMLPAVPGVIVWDGAGAMPGYILDALASYRPGGSRAAESAQIAAALAAQPAVVVGAAIVIAGVLLAATRGR